MFTCALKYSRLTKAVWVDSGMIWLSREQLVHGYFLIKLLYYATNTTQLSILGFLTISQGLFINCHSVLSLSIRFEVSRNDCWMIWLLPSNIRVIFRVQVIDLGPFPLWDMSRPCQHKPMFNLSVQLAPPCFRGAQDSAHLRSALVWGELLALTCPVWGTGDGPALCCSSDMVRSRPGSMSRGCPTTTCWMYGLFPEELLSASIFLLKLNRGAMRNTGE